MNSGTFLRARWRWLAMVNFEVEPRVLRPICPPGVELDDHDGRTLMSLVAFEFSHAKLLGVPIPGFQRFPELNLRFYVRRHIDGEVRRGVVFVKEIVPLRMVAWVANTLFHTSFAHARLRHRIERTPRGATVEYLIAPGDGANRIALDALGEPMVSDSDAEAAFVVDRNYAYNPSRSGVTIEYEVRHRPWRVWAPHRWAFHLDAVEALYGRELAEALNRPPRSAFLVDGSDVTVCRGIPVSMCAPGKDKRTNERTNRWPSIPRVS